MMMTRGCRYATLISRFYAPRCCHAMLLYAPCAVTLPCAPPCHDAAAAAMPAADAAIDIIISE